MTGHFLENFPSPTATTPKKTFLLIFVFVQCVIEKTPFGDMKFFAIFVKKYSKSHCQSYIKGCNFAGLYLELGWP